MLFFIQKFDYNLIFFPTFKRLILKSFAKKGKLNSGKMFPLDLKRIRYNSFFFFREVHI